MNVLRLAIWLTTRGLPIILYAIEGSVLWQKAVESNIPVRHIKSSFKQGDFVNSHRLAKLLSEDNVRILVIHERRHIMLASLAKLGVGTRLKLVYMQHMHIGVDKKDLYHTWLYDNLDAWVVPLEILKERLLSKTNYAPDKVAVIPFGIEMERFTTALPSKEESRESLGLPTDAFIVGMVGRLEPEKCQETLVRACAMLNQEGRAVLALIVGNETMHEQSGYLPYLKKLVEDLGNAESVHFHPATANVEQVYAAMDIFALTSKSETYGMVTIEAMASGLPVIGTRHGGTREIIRDGINGILIEREDPEALAAAIRTLHDSPDLARKLAQAARQDAVALYSRDRQCDLTEQLFSKLLKSPPENLS